MPIVLLRGSPTVVVPFYVDLPYAIANPFALADIVSPCVGGTIQELTARQAGWRCTASRCATSSPRRRGPCAVACTPDPRAGRTSPAASGATSTTPSSRISQYNEPAYAMDLLSGGTAGMAYLLKERIGDPHALVGAVRDVVAGGSRIDPDVVAALVRAGRTSSPLAALGAREWDVLELMAQGRTNAAIAERLHLSESSIEKYASSLFAKLGLIDEPRVHRRVAAVLTYLHDQGGALPVEPGER